MYNKKLLAIVVLALTLGANVTSASAVENKDLEAPIGTKLVATNKDTKIFATKTEVEPMKIFAIKFNYPVTPEEVEQNITITDSKGREVPFLEFKKDSINSNTIKILPPGVGYTRGETYILEIYKGIASKDERTLKHNVKMQFTISKNDTIEGGDVFKDRSHAEMTAILKDMSNGIYSDRVIPDEEVLYEDTDKYDFFDYISLDCFKSIIKRAPYLEEKYFKNKTYSDLVNLNNYKELPNLAINFDKVNNLNSYDDSVDGVVWGSPDQTQNDIPHDELKHIVNEPKLTKQHGKDRWVFVTRLDKDKRFFKVIWRPDIEKEMIEEINKIRISKGMQPLKVKNDLYAMARFGAKRSQFGFSKLHNTNKLISSVTGYERYWEPGVIPYPNKHHEWKGGLCYKNCAKLEDSAKELFGYNGKLKAISWNSNYYTTAKQFLDQWQISQIHEETGFVLKNSTLKDLQNSLPSNILNPNMKYIGVGSTYEVPIHKNCHNGTLGVFVVVE